MQPHLIPLPKFQHRNQAIQQQIQCKCNSNLSFSFGIDWDQHTSPFAIQPQQPIKSFYFNHCNVTIHNSSGTPQK